MNILLKKCIGECERVLPEIEDFFSFRKDTGKFRNECKKCRNKKSREYYKENPNRYYNTRKQYRLDHPWIESYIYAKQRCTNPNNTHYKWYGGRGIKFQLTVEEVKELWFRDKAYNMDSPTIDRINNNADYKFSNCRFIEKIENIKRQDRSKFCKPILQFDLEGNFIKEWKSQKEASDKLNIKTNGINAVLRGRQNTCYGFKWEYKNEKDKN